MTKHLSGPMEIFEHFAELFQKETGMMAPGKDQPAELGNSPDIDQRGKRYAEWLQADGWMRAKEMRLAYAIDLTREAMAMCDVPFHIRDQQIEQLKKQMAENQQVEAYATCQVEQYWRYRELKDIRWSGVDVEADAPRTIRSLRLVP